MAGPTLTWHQPTLCQAPTSYQKANKRTHNFLFSASQHCYVKSTLQVPKNRCECEDNSQEIQEKKVVGRMTRKFQKKEKRSLGNFCHKSFLEKKSQSIYIDLSIHSFSSDFQSWSSHPTKQNTMGNSKILVVGATGAIGQFIIKASAQLGHPTFALVRPTTAGPHSSKKELIDSFKASGITILEVNRLNPQLFLSFFNSFLSCEVQ